MVPAHTGGADLSKLSAFMPIEEASPRPHGRGGFKLLNILGVGDQLESPPTRAGRI